ncbi:MAG: septum formation protein [Oleispira sp.]|jgi:septum formation protein
MSHSLVLASTSPRRKELLQQIGVIFTQLNIDINEDVAADESAEQYVLRLAKEKAAAGFELLSATEKANHVVLAADTTVVCDGLILAKPESMSHSKEILSQLSGREHIVMSAIGFHSLDKTLQKVVTTKVRFRSISDAEIEAYWHSGEPQDKAGSYGIQGLGAVFVESITGSYSNVVGLPLCETAQLLNQFNIAFWQL